MTKFKTILQNFSLCKKDKERLHERVKKTECKQQKNGGKNEKTKK